MAFCTHCGAQLIQNAKFCSSCGGSISTPNKRTETEQDKHSAYDEIMHKRVPKSIKDKVKNTIEEKTQEFNEKSFSDSKVSSKSSAPIQNTPTIDLNKERSKKVRKWMLFYILINIPLYFINTGDDEILGVLIFSTAVLVGFVLHSLQKKKEKPYTIVLKIVLVLQSLLAVSGIMQRLEYMGSSGYSLVAVISLALLVFLNIKIIFRRNK